MVIAVSPAPASVAEAVEDVELSMEAVVDAVSAEAGEDAT